MKKSIRKKRWIIFRRLMLLWLVYMAVCLVVPPLFHPAAGDPESGRVLQSGAQERVRSIDDNLEALLWRLRLIEEAQEELILCTFDFRDDNSGRDMMAALFHAADRGVKVRIMVDGINGGLYLNRSKNFQELTAHENVQAKLYNPVSLWAPWRINYRMHGIHTYEYLGGQALHTKAVLAGDRISFVGSCNLDMRSVYLDTELMLRIDCRELNEEIRSQAKELKAGSRHVYPDGTVEDGEDYRPVKPGPVKRVLYGVLRVLVIPIRHLL